MGKTILFVYGTLRRGQGANYFLRTATFLGEVVTESRYRKLNLGAYPGLIEVEDGEAVAGELWEVDDALLDTLDEYEGAPTLFARGPIALAGRGEAQAYFYRGRVL